MRNLTLLFFLSGFFIFSSDIRSQGLWAPIDSIPLSPSIYNLEGGVGFSINGKGYFALGDTSTCTYITDLWEYDPVSDSWTQKANYIGTARWGAVAFVVNNIAYVGAGYDRITGSQNSFFAYHPLTNSWSTISSLPGTPRVYSSSFTAYNKGYVGLGGWYNGATGACDTAYSQLWEYDPAIDHWARKTDFPGGARLNAVGFSLLNKGYLGTGCQVATGTTYTGKDMWEYSPLTDSWLQRADLPSAEVMAASSFSIANMGYLTCGMSYSSFVETWKFDPQTNVWVRMVDFPGTDHFLSSYFSIGTKGYMVGGGFVTDAWSFDSSVLGINEQNSYTDNATIFPNPMTTNGVFKLSKNLKKDLHFLLYDSGGSQVLEKEISEKETGISRGSLKNGIYFWKLTDNNNLLSSGKLILQ